MSNRSYFKKKLRSEYLKKRTQVSKRHKNKWDLSIFNRLITLKSYIDAKTVHVYISNSEKNEVDTFQLIHHAHLNEKKVVVPKVVGDGLLKHFEIKSTEDLKSNRWGIPEPRDGEEVKVRDLDLIIVPMVSGDRNRNRLGYGKGFYDRFLAESNAFKIGLLYELQLHPEDLPSETFDIPLDLLLTESEQI